MNKSQFLIVALDAVKKAEEVILSYYSQKVEYTTKSDNSPVTIADKRGEKIIIETIKVAFPDHAFLGEESGAEQNESAYTWIIDPIDGTKNFSRHIPLFATQLALMKDGEIILGISNAPALGELIYAEKGHGAWQGEQKISVSDVSKLSDAYFCFGGMKYFTRHNKLEALAHIVEKTFGHRGIGDFWCYHLLAQGKIEIMVEAETKIWDFAALKIIIEEAGGMFTDMQGNAISKESTSVIATNGKTHQKVLDFFQ